MRVPRRLSALVWSTPVGPLYKRVRTRLWLRYSRGARARLFDRYFSANEWGADESRSGPGSTLEETQALRNELPRFLEQHAIHTLLDAPCGDFYWMKGVDLGEVRYIGADIVPELIRDLEREFGSDAREFHCLDLATDRLPPCDAVLCRDLLIHLPNSLGRRVLDNVRSSRARWLLTTTYQDVSVNEDCGVGDCRAINLTLPPFGLPEPDFILAEGPIDQEVELGRCLGAWRLEDGTRDLPLAHD